MVGLKYDSLATRIAVPHDTDQYNVDGAGRESDGTILTREHAPPMVTIPWFAYSPRLPVSKGRVNLMPWRCWAQVAKANGLKQKWMGAALSNEILCGACSDDVKRNGSGISLLPSINLAPSHRSVEYQERQPKQWLRVTAIVVTGPSRRRTELTKFGQREKHWYMLSDEYPSVKRV